MMYYRTGDMGRYLEDSDDLTDDGGSQNVASCDRRRSSRHKCVGK
jgi:hypothetical protein